MPDNYSFDVVSDFDRQEVVNALDQAQREVRTRYDLKDSKTAIKDILQSKAIKRGLSLKVFKFGKVEPAPNARYRQVVDLQKGLNEDLAKSLAKEIRTSFPK